MITNAILTIFYGFISVITSPISALPDASLPANISNAINQASSYLSMIGSFFPIATFLTILGLFLLIEGGIFAYKIIMWVIRKIPTIS